jgi:hypothetical protein
MHFNNAIILAAIASSTAAFVLPAGLRDGTYFVHYNEEGREVHQPVETVNSTTLDKRQEVLDVEGLSFSPLSKRQRPVDNFSCGCGYTLNPGDCDAAVADLTNQLNHGGGPNNCGVIPRERAWYSIRGSVVAFACVGLLADEPIVICGKDLADSLSAVTGRCGRYMAGTMMRTMYSPNLEIGIAPSGAAALGYMRYSDGLDFCKHAEDDRATKC